VAPVQRYEPETDDDLPFDGGSAPVNDDDDAPF
jgi:hypothetical protein